METMLSVLFQVTAIVCLLVAIRAQTFESFFPRAKRCGLKYGSVLKKSPWVCEHSHYQEYPEPQINNFMKYASVKNYLGVTESCVNYHDSDFKGKNDYYSYESLCAIKRTPIHVIWAHVPGFKGPADAMALNGGKLPVHVVKGQRLYDVECLHPWARSQEIQAEKAMLNPQSKPKRRPGMGISWTSAKRNLCYLGYMYKRNYVCQPSGFVQQDVLVYSSHANTMFLTRVTDIPTSCACTYCDCATPTPFNDPWNF